MPGPDSASASELPFYQFLIHHRLLEQLRNGRPELRALVQKTLERLQLGEWGNGTRVKQLRGVRVPVFEARVDRALRMLFTIRRAPAQHAGGEPESYALVWDVVEHDAVTRRARRLNAEPEAGFLDFAVVGESDIHEPPADASVEFADNDSLPTVVTRLRRPTAAAGIELTEPIRWFRLAPDDIIDDAAWQALMDAGRAAELELKLTREQAGMVNLPGPVLLRGAAGSGKTTVSVYRVAGIAASWPEARILYVTYNAGLLQTARSQFADLCAVRSIKAHAKPDFLTFPALCHRLTHNRFARAECIRFPRFEAWYRGVYAATDAALAWEEIRGIIKGACLDPFRSHLNRQEYEELGRKRAPLFRDERARLFRAFERYQAWCDGQSRTDDIDLARAACRDVNETWDFVVCDEGQDLTELEVALLLRLCNRPDGLFFAADPQQTVNPSGFRWAEIRSLLRRTLPSKQAPDIVGLSRNFRSVAAIVATANAIVQLQRERTGRTDDDHLQESTLRGPAPLVVGGDPEVALASLRGFGPRCAVIVPDGQSGEALTAALDSERVFPVAEAKGLEFDGCVLWNLLSSDLPLWEELLTGHATLNENPAARRALRHLYVAVTRSRRYLGMYEREPRAVELWRESVFRGIVEQDGPEALRKFMLSVGSPEEWAEEGEWFLERSRYRQAAECFRRANLPNREQAARAAWRHSVGEFALAATLYESVAEWVAAADCHEALGNWQRASELYDLGDEPGRAASAHEKYRNWTAAARAWQAAGSVDDATRCRLEDRLQKRDWVQAAQLARALGKLDVAATCYRRAGMKRELQEMQLAAAQAGGDHAAQAAIHQGQRQWDVAAAAWEAAGNSQNAARCRAELAEESNDPATAAPYWAIAGEPARAARAEAAAAEAAGDLYRAAEIWHLAGKLAERDRVLARADVDMHAKAWYWHRGHELQWRDPLMAVCEFEKADRFQEAVALATFISKATPEALIRKKVAADPVQAAQLVLAFFRSNSVMRCQWHVRNPQKVEEVEGIYGHMLWAGDEPETVRLMIEAADELDDPMTAAACRYELGETEAAMAALAVPGSKTQLQRRLKIEAEKENWLQAARFSALSGQTRKPHEYRAQHYEYIHDYATAATHWRLAGRTAKANDCEALAEDEDLP